MTVHTHVMAEKRNPLGPTGETVRANVKRLRDGQNLGYAKLARRLEDVGRPIPELGLRRIETGTRRVDADDLMALAAALDVSPATLLMPGTAEGEATVEATATPEEVTAQQLWAWLTAKRGIGLEGREQLAWLLGAVPHWALNITMGTPDVVVAVGPTAEGEVDHGNN
jgi:transcriptional regulator with XRE-family HTH domain